MISNKRDELAGALTAASFEELGRTRVARFFRMIDTVGGGQFIERFVTFNLSLHFLILPFSK